MDDFTQFQLKEYENISQAHFKTNEVLSTFYRYFLLITATPITAIGISLINVSEDGIDDDGRIIAYIIFGVSTILLSAAGSAIIAYIEGLRLDAILYARVVNSIRDFFFKLPDAEKFGLPVLPTKRNKPTYGGFGAAFIMYFACAILNSAYFAAGVLALMLDRTVPLVSVQVTQTQRWITIAAFVFMLEFQAMIKNRLVAAKAKKGF